MSRTVVKVRNATRYSPPEFDEVWECDVCQFRAMTGEDFEESGAMCLDCAKPYIEQAEQLSLEVEGVR